MMHLCAIGHRLAGSCTTDTAKPGAYLPVRVLGTYWRGVMTEEPATFLIKNATRYAMIGALILAALLGGYAWKGQTLPAQPAGPPAPMTIAANTRYTGTGLVFIAQGKGYFAN